MKILAVIFMYVLLIFIVIFTSLRKKKKIHTFDSKYREIEISGVIDDVDIRYVYNSERYTYDIPHLNMGSGSHAVVMDILCNNSERIKIIVAEAYMKSVLLEDDSWKSDNWMDQQIRWLVRHHPYDRYMKFINNV